MNITETQRAKNEKHKQLSGRARIKIQLIIKKIRQRSLHAIDELEIYNITMFYVQLWLN